MEGDANVGRMLDALQELGLAQDTIVVFASDNGPQGEVVRQFGGDMPDMGSPGPFRGELADASEGSIRTAALIRWPGQIGARSSYAMFSIMDFFPTLARLAGGKVPDDRPIDGIDQTDLLLGRSATGHREALPTFVGSISLPHGGNSSARILPTWHPVAVGGAGRTCFPEPAAAPRP